MNKDFWVSFGREDERIYKTHSAYLLVILQAKDGQNYFICCLNIVRYYNVLN